jgi:hypothetical protein
MWQGAKHTLYWCGRLVKHFRRDAPLQEAVLDAFENLHWVDLLPISSLAEQLGRSKKKLQTTIKNLNRNVRPLLRFHLEGSGTRVAWELASLRSSARHRQ